MERGALGLNVPTAGPLPHGKRRSASHCRLEGRPLSRYHALIIGKARYAAPWAPRVPLIWGKKWGSQHRIKNEIGAYKLCLYSHFCVKYMAFIV